MVKKKRHIIYIAIMCVLAIATYGYLLSRGGLFDFEAFLFWSFLAIIAETFHILLPSGAAQSVGMATYIAAVISAGPLVAGIVPIMGFLFCIPKKNGELMFFYKYKASIVLYNIASHVIIISLSGLIYSIFVDSGSDITRIIVFALIILTINELLSLAMVSGYFYTRDGANEIPFIRSFFGALPSTWAVGALGIFLAFAAMNYGRAIVALFFIPLLLARYSMKLYFDSQKMSMETIHALNDALLVKDNYTSTHTERVEEYAVMLGKVLNYNASSLDRLRKAARLHDIGKIGIPDGILNKTGQLTKDEYEQIKEHAAMGAQILGNVDSLKRISEIVRYHHERPDGKGYPDGLTDEKIPRDAAILSIADTYDAMTSDRPYRKALPKEVAVAELKKYKGTQFNAYLVDVFVDHIDVYEASKLDIDDDLVELTTTDSKLDESMKPKTSEA